MTRALQMRRLLLAIATVLPAVLLVILLALACNQAPDSPPEFTGVAPQQSPATAAIPSRTLDLASAEPPSTATLAEQEATIPPPQAPSPSPTPGATVGPASWLQPGYPYGIHLLLDDGRNHWLPQQWPQHVEAARQIVGEGGYVVQLIRLDDLDVKRWQFFLDLCAQQHLVPIIRLATTYDHVNKWWEAPPRDTNGQGYSQVAKQYRAFLARLRWPTIPHYVIVHNEPNRGDEWSNQPSAAEYAQFLLDVGQALHSLDITVLAPALDLYAPHSNGQLIGAYRYIDAETFLDEMAAALPQAFQEIDVWASHAYPLDPFRLDPSRQEYRIDYANGATNPRHLEPPEGISNRGVNSYRWELWKLEQILGPRAATLPVLITETGWRHAPSQEPQARDGVHAEISFETQSTYLDLAFWGNQGRYPGLPETGWTPWNDDPQVMAVVLFALGGYPLDWGHTNWVVLDDLGRVINFYPINLPR